MLAPLFESPAIDQSNWERVIVPPLAVPASFTLPTIVSAFPIRTSVRVVPRLSLGSVGPVTVRVSSGPSSVEADTPATFQVPARQLPPLSSQSLNVWSARL